MNLKTTLRSLSKFVLFPAVIIYLCCRLWIEFAAKEEEAPGSFHVIDGFNVHVVCKGSGGETVLFETGFGSDSFQTWDKVAKKMSERHRSCYYDRLGTGWSDALPDTFGTTEKAKLLSGVIDSVGQGQAVILVAHSYGGILARQALNDFDASVSKLVLVDSAHENQHTRLDPYLLPIPQYIYYGVLADAITGYSRIKSLLSGHEQGRLASYYSSFDYSGVLKSYVDEKGFYTPLNALSYDLKDIPLLVLEHDPDTYPDNERWNNANVIWKELQRELVTLSANSSIHMIKGASHNIPGDQPEKMVAQIVEFTQ